MTYVQYIYTTNTAHARVVASYTHLGSGETHLLSHLIRHLHGLLGISHVILAELDPLLGGGRATTKETLFY